MFGKGQTVFQKFEKDLLLLERRIGEQIVRENIAADRGFDKQNL